MERDGGHASDHNYPAEPSPVSYRQRPASTSYFGDVKFAARWLRRSPGFVAVAAASPPIGIAFNATRIAVVDSILLHLLPVRASVRTGAHRTHLYGVSATGPVAWAAQLKVLLSIAALANIFLASRAARVDPNVALRTDEGAYRLHRDFDGERVTAHRGGSSMKRIGLLSAAFAAMLTVACGGDANNDRTAANDTAAVGTAGEGANAEADRNTASAGARDWVEDRMVGGMTEVKLGELASQKAQNADVKAFGRMMVQDHTKAGEELKQLASQHKIQPPAQLDDEHRDKVDRLSKLQGAEFDREYMSQMVDDHENTIEALEDRLDKQGNDENATYTPKKTDNRVDTALNQWAAKTAPTVQKHLARAKQLNDKIGRRTTDDNR
jgi:putative membrane protein